MDLKFVSLIGVLAFIAIAWAASQNRRLFPWRTVLWGLGLQACFGLLILKTPWGAWLFEFASSAVQKLIGFSNEGSKFVFGPLADSEALGQAFKGSSIIFAVLVTSTIILVSSLSTLFYHWGLLQRVVHGIAWVMRKAMRTSGSETLSAAANIFMGQTEAPLLIKPYMAGMTRSEIHCMMVGGMATIAGGVAAVYAGMGAAAGHPEIAGHLLTASVMNAPAALLISKIMLPETEVSETAGAAPKDPPRATINSLDALCRGASEGIMLSINVLAMLIAFVAVVAMVNFLIASPQTWFGAGEPVTLQDLLGWANAPFAWLMGIPSQDCLKIGAVLGERIVLNEFVGYMSLTRSTLEISDRAFIIATYALCGFANFSSIAIQVGGIGSLAPSRRADLAKFGFRAMIGGLLATYTTAAIAGVLL